MQATLKVIPAELIERISFFFKKNITFQDTSKNSNLLTNIACKEIITYMRSKPPTVAL